MGAAVGRLGWPRVPSPYFPGERCLACPRCGSVDVVLTSVPAGPGTGPYGRHRLGDPAREANRCGACGHRTVESESCPLKPR